MREALLCCIGWVLAYACMWMLKWGSTFSCWGRTESPPSATKSPSGCPRAANPTPGWILLRNIRIVTDKTAYRVILLAVLALLSPCSSAAGCAARRPRALLLLPLLAPVLWTLALPTTHPTGFYFTNFIETCAALFSRFCAPALAPDRTPFPLNPPHEETP